MPTKRIFSEITNLIPKSIDDHYKTSPTDFTRNSQLTGPTLLGFILSIVASDKKDGIDIQSGDYFKNLRRSGIIANDDQAVQRSGITKARKKLSWKQFEDIGQKAVSLAYELWPDDNAYQWHGMNVIAIDGSKHSLPGSEEIRIKYDPESCQLSSCKQYFPQGLVSIAYDPFRGIPIARKLSHAKASEREDALALMNEISLENVLYIMDRGYPSYSMFWQIQNRQSHFLIRCKGKTTFKAVENFLESGKLDEYITISPKSCRTSLIDAPKKELKSIVIRAIRYIAEDGNVSALLTDLLDTNEFSTDEIVTLYHDRWEVETNYRHEKCSLGIETFHSRSVNGILQEFYAIGFISVITRLLMVWVNNEKHEAQPRQKIAPQFKNSIKKFASDVAIFVAHNPRRALKLFKEVLEEIGRVKYQRPKNKRKPCPRYTKKACSKWIRKRAKLAKGN